jgi:GNAT superfamily N-acetyltransferase
MITIRRAQQEDCESVFQVHIRAIKEICTNHYTQEEVDSWSNVLKPGRYRKGIQGGPFFVAVDGDVIVGFSNLNQKSGELEAVYVDPGYVGTGVGMKLLQALESAAKASGLSFLHLSSSLNAVSFYERAGYKSQNHTRYLLPFGMVACVPMGKKL